MRVIAIDGPAGSGKSTIGRALADRLGLTYLDTGAMYRAVAFAVLRDGVALDDDIAVGTIARGIDLKIGDGFVSVDGVDVTDEVRGPEVSAAVSAVAALPSVREVLRDRQRTWAAEMGGGVIEGRDIGSVVLPDAILKVYLTASAEVRAARRALQLGETDTESIAKAMAARDIADSTRADSPLVEPDGSVTVDSTGLGIDEVVDVLVELMESRS